MKTETTLAASKIISGKSKVYREARSEIEPGNYEVDALLRISGNLRVEEDTSRVSTSNFLNEEFLLLVLKHAGVTRDASARAMEAILSIYLKDWTGTPECKKAAKKQRKDQVEEFDPDGKVRAMFDNLKEALPRIPCKGKVVWKGTVEEVEVIPTEIQLEEAAKTERVA